MELHETVSKVIKEICKKYSISPNEIGFYKSINVFSNVYILIFIIAKLDYIVYAFINEKGNNELDIFLSENKVKIIEKIG